MCPIRRAHIDTWITDIGLEVADPGALPIKLNKVQLSSCRGRTLSHGGLTACVMPAQVSRFIRTVLHFDSSRAADRPASLTLGRKMLHNSGFQGGGVGQDASRRAVRLCDLHLRQRG